MWRNHWRAWVPARKMVYVPLHEDLRIEEHRAVAAQLADLGLRVAWGHDPGDTVIEYFEPAGRMVIPYALDPADALRRALRLWYRSSAPHPT